MVGVLISTKEELRIMNECMGVKESEINVVYGFHIGVWQKLGGDAEFLKKCGYLITALKE